MHAELLILTSLIIIAALLHRFAARLGIPVLLAFIALGLFMGIDGPFHIDFDNYELTEKLCSLALVLIMFDGGFGTSWKRARSIALPGALLATFGVLVTACVSALGAHYLLHVPWFEALLIGAVLSSTDAASVFSILRSSKLGLKNRTDSLLEIESGSNDPMAYMLTVIILSLGDTPPSISSILLSVFTQICVGIAVGVGVAFMGLKLLKAFGHHESGLYMVLAASIGAFSYASASMLGGNGYLATYITGIILGNSTLREKKQLVSFFDGLTTIAHMALFFLLGLLATPSNIPAALPTALGIAAILTFVARPLAVFLTLLPFRIPFRAQALIAFSGLRGAASIVFAIMAIIGPGSATSTLYTTVFTIVILSITIQGSLLPYVAHLLKMTDSHVNVLESFTDWQEIADLSPRVDFDEVHVEQSNTWVGSRVDSLHVSPGEVIVMIIRGEEVFVPRPATRIFEGDRIVIARNTTVARKENV